MAKRSRRSRRQEARKQKQVVTVPTTPAEETTPEIGESTQEDSSLSRKILDFTQEYTYVYFDLRNVLIITIAMFILLFGLSFAI